MNLDIVVPFYNEEDCASDFIKHLISTFEKINGIILSCYFVDDGSEDRTPEILDKFSLSDKRINIIHLWGNHGHQRALIAGLDKCGGDAVLTMDGDGQHPVNVAICLIQKLLAHPEIAIIQGIRSKGQRWSIKDWMSSTFYIIMNYLCPKSSIERGASDFRIIRKSVLELLKCYPDRHRNLRILISQLNLPTICVEYKPLVRLGGKSKFTWRKMIQLATDGIFAFSSLPLRLGLLLMTISGTLGLTYASYSLIRYFQNRVFPGWTSIIALTSILFSAVFAVLAIQAEYIKRIYEDVRKHPIYAIRPPILKDTSENIAKEEKTHFNE